MAHELALNPNIQQKLYEEISAVQKQLDGVPVTYEAIQKMKYLDMVISETLRKWPTSFIIDRVCNKSIDLDNNGRQVHINKGDGFIIPVYAIHRDAKYYPNPDEFDPTRFSEENSKNIQSGTYLPFGIGPRSCIATRFALLECKALFYYMLLEFRLEKCDKTPDPFVFGIALTATSAKGFWLQITRR